MILFYCAYCVLSLYFTHWCVDLFSSTSAKVFILFIRFIRSLK